MSSNISENIRWTGAEDWNAREFHSYKTEKGTTYNAYVISGEKTAVIDTVKAAFSDVFLRRVKEAAGSFSNISYVISNHGEPDHSGALPALMELAGNAEVIATPKGAEILRAQYGERGWKIRTVKGGESVSLGGRSLTFIPMPMVHWPDSMMSYCPEEETLFSNDAFGQHWASSRRFDGELELGELMTQAAKYYANIVMPYGAQAAKALESAKKLPGLKFIAPSHGAVWRDNIPAILDKYAFWSANKTREKAVIAYDTMWGAPRKIAEAISEGFAAAGIPASLMELKFCETADVMLEILEAKYVCVGSPTMNNNILPSAAAFLAYMRGLAPKGRLGFAFGSYGWGGQSVEQVAGELSAMGFGQLAPDFLVKYTPGKETLAQLARDVRAAVEGAGG
jgi:flavorubredoxin